MLNGTAAHAPTRLWYRDRLIIATRLPETLGPVEVTKDGRRTVADSARTSRLSLVAWVAFMFVDSSDDPIMIPPTRDQRSTHQIYRQHPPLLGSSSHRRAHAAAKNLLSLKRRSLEFQMRCIGNHPVDSNKVGHTRYEHYRLALLRWQIIERKSPCRSTGPLQRVRLRGISEIR